MILFVFTAVIFSKVKLWETIYFLLIPLFKHELNIIAQHVFFPTKSTLSSKQMTSRNFLKIKPT